MQELQIKREPRWQLSRHWWIVMGALLFQVGLVGLLLFQPRGASEVTLAAEKGHPAVCRVVGVIPSSGPWDEGLRVGMDVRVVGEKNVSNCQESEIPRFVQIVGQQTNMLLEATPQQVDPTDLLLASLLMLIFDLAGAALFLRALNRPTARVAAALFLCTSLTISLYMLYRPDLAWTQMSLFFLSLVTRGLSTTFVCLFPHPMGRRTKKNHWSRIWPYVPLLLGIVLAMVTPCFIFGPQQLPMVLPLNVVYNTACLGVTLWVLGWGLRELSGHERQLARMIIVGVVFLLLPLAFLSLNTFQQDLMALPSLIHLTLLPLAILPILSDYVLFRHQLLGNTSLFSRRIMRVLLWLLLASLFIVPAIILLRTLDQGGMPSEERRDYLYTGLLLGSLWLFPLAWNKLRDVGDTFLYHDFYQYNRSLREISRALTQLRGLGQICIFLLPRLANMLNASDVALLVRTERDRAHMEMGGAQQGWQCYGNQTSKKTLAQEHLRGVADLALTHLRQPQDEPLLIDDVLVTPLYDGEHVSGLLCLGAKHNLEPYERQDKSFLMTLAAQLAVLEVNSRYLERAQADALQLAALSRRVVGAQEEERRHLALELHDDALQQAMLLSRQLADARDMTEVAEAMPLARSVVSSLRHTCLELRPPLLDELGLCEALNWLAKQHEQRSGWQVRIRLIVGDVLASERLAAPIELALYRVIQEALSNILKHANASQVVIKLHQNREGLLTVLVGDNGRGFRPGLVRTERLGLVGMHERMRSIGGEFRIRSTPGRGTCVCVRIETRAHSEQTGNDNSRNKGQLPLTIEILGHTGIQA